MFASALSPLRIGDIVPREALGLGSDTFRRRGMLPSGSFPRCVLGSTCLASGSAQQESKKWFLLRLENETSFPSLPGITLHARALEALSPGAETPVEL